MSDFDKFIAEKLEEEGDFPHRDRNWRQMAQRLHAFEIGGSGRPSAWHYWPAAAAVAVSLTVAGWLLWKMQTVQQENVALKQEIAALRQSLPPVTPATTLPEKSLLSPTIAEKSIDHSQRRLPNDHIMPAVLSEKSKAEQLHYSPAKSATSTQRALPEKKVENKKQFDQLNNQPIATTTTKLDAIKSADLIDHASDTLAKLTNNKVQESTLTTEAPLSFVAADSLQLASSVTPQDSSKTTIAAQSPNAVAVPLVTLPDSVATASVPPPIIQPARRPSRFRVGIEAVAGKFLEKEPGISSILGSGITASYSPLRFLRLTASADWLHFDVNTSSYVPQCHVPQHAPPMHMHPHDQLVQVESQQRQQHFALGLAYTLPVHGWLHPSVRVAHTWVHIAPGLVSFKFEEEPGPGPGHGPREPEYVAQKFEGQTLSNIWRVGAGLEHELPRWTFGLWADYSKNLAATESTFDVLSVRAGVQYKFN